jgi:hypothetical protein
MAWAATLFADCADNVETVERIRSKTYDPKSFILENMDVMSNSCFPGILVMFSGDVSLALKTHNSYDRRDSVRMVGIIIYVPL